VRGLKKLKQSDVSRFVLIAHSVGNAPSQLAAAAQVARLITAARATQMDADRPDRVSMVVLRSCSESCEMIRLSAEGSNSLIIHWREVNNSLRWSNQHVHPGVRARSESIAEDCVRWS
jgi:pimeloyl-ACP methyl ester carboxylesterase